MTVKRKIISKTKSNPNQNMTKQNHILYYSENKFDNMSQGSRMSTGSLLWKVSLNRNSSAVGVVSRHPEGRELTSDWSVNSFKMVVYEEKKLVILWIENSELKNMSIYTRVRSEYSCSVIQDVVSMCFFPQQVCLISLSCDATERQKEHGNYNGLQ